MKFFSKNLLVLLFLVASGAAAKAQDSGPKAFTLEEAVKFAIDHNVAVKNERLGTGIAKAQVGEIFAQGLPQISVSGNLTYNIARQTNFLPGAFMGQSGFIPVQFGTPYASNVSATLSQLIFDGSYFVGLRAAKVFKSLADKTVDVAEIDVAESVSLAYYGALVAEERLELLAANLQRLDTLYNETRIMNENGFAEAIDVQRIKVNLNNTRTEYQNVQRSLGLNLSMLKFQMGIPVDHEIELGETIEDFEVPELALIDDFEFNDRADYQQLKVNRELSLLEIKNTKAKYLPKLSAFANFGYNAGRETFGELFEPTVLIAKDESGKVISEQTVDTWNKYSAVGLNLEVPIFDGFLKTNTIRRQKLVSEQVENQIKNLENGIELEIQQARITLENNLQILATQKENRELAEEVYRISKIKYQEGVGSSLEVTEAENALKAAETNYYQALYEALVARTAYKKATGTLYQK